MKLQRLASANAVFLFLSVIFLSAGAYFQNADLNSGIVLTELVIVLLPAVIFSSIYKTGSIIDFLRLRLVSPKVFISAFAITLLTYPLAVFGNSLAIFILSLFGNVELPEVPIASNLNEFILYIVLIGVLPGFCEEVLFRGFFLRMNSTGSEKFAVLFTAFMFALFHYNIYNFMGPLVLGIVFGYITLITGSIWPAVFCHALNNSIASTLGYVMLQGDGATQAMPEGVDMLLAMGMQLAVLGVISLACAKGLKKKLKKLRENFGVQDTEIAADQAAQSGRLKLLIYAPIAVCVVIFIYLNVTFI